MDESTPSIVAPTLGKAQLNVIIKQVGPRCSTVNYGGYQDLVVDNKDLEQESPQEIAAGDALMEDIETEGVPK